MKIYTLLLTGLIAVANIQAEENTLTLRFTANHTCTYIQLDSVLVENLTLEGSRTLFYPDTVLANISTFIEQVDEAYDGLYVSQNYPNPFSNVTDIDIYVPDPDLFRINVHDMLGRLLVVHDVKLEPGLHHFTFHACEQQTYVLTVSSEKYMQQRLMVQFGRGGGQAPGLVYIGRSSHQVLTSPRSASTIKATLKSAPDFNFEPGDELRFTGYLTSPFTLEAEYAVITDSPESDTDYLFDLADSAPERPSEISGPHTVMKYFSNLGYEVEFSPGLTYNWEVPEGWSVTAGQGTNAVTVDSGYESGDIEVRAANNCGESPSSIFPVTILHTLTLQASPPGAGTVSGGGNYAEGDLVAITVTTGSGYHFVNWTDDNGNEVSDQAEFDFTMAGNDLILTANFAELKTLTLIADPEAGGTLTGDGEYREGEEVMISALPNPFYRFAGWESPAGSFENADDAATVFTMPDEDITVTAVFETEPQQENTFDFVVETTEDMTEYRFVVDGAVNFGVLWDDGVNAVYNGNALPSHDFGEAGKWTIRVRGTASRIAFSTEYDCQYAQMLRDILTPISEGVSGLISSNGMFMGTEVESFSSIDFFDEASAGVTDMSDMFSNSAFNQDISNWDAGMTFNMSGMFSGSAFDQDISSWDIARVSDFTDFLEGAEFTPANYNNLLIGWSELNLRSDVTFNGGSSRYDLGLPAERREYIITEFGWTIIDGGDTGSDYLSENLTLNVEPAEGGSAESEGQYYEGGIVNITATAGEGYEFHSWTGDIEYVDDPQAATTTVTMPSGSVVLVANFTLTAISCKCLLEDGVTASGLYTILLDDTPKEVFCDMTTDGGGWTLVAVSAQGGSEWTWNNLPFFTTNRTVFGSLDDMDLSSQSFANNYKNTGLHDIEVKDVMVRWASDLDSKWASYHHVSDGTQSLSAVIEAQPVSSCAPNNPGYAKNAGDNFGDLDTGGERGYCGERLYFNLRNTEGSSVNCGIGANNYSTYGPSFNYRLSHGICTDGSSGPYNEPSYTGFGPCYNTRFSQRGVVHNANAWTDLGLSSDGVRRSMLLFVR